MRRVGDGGRLLAAGTVSVVALALSLAGAVGAGAAAAASTRAPAGTVLVTNLDTNSIAAINPVTGSVSSIYGTGLNGPLGVAIAPDGTTAYVTNSLGDTVSPVDLRSFPYRVGRPIKVGGAPSAIALSPNGTVAYVSNFNSNTVTPINLATDVAQRAIAVGPGPWSLAVSTDGAKVIVSNSESTTVSIIDLATRRVATVDVGGRPEAIAVAPRSDVAYVLSGSDVLPIRLAAAHPVVGAPIVVVDKPVGIAIAPRGTSAYTVNADNTVTQIDLTSSPAGVSPAVQVGSLSQADGVAISPDGRHAYIANASNTVTPISLVGGVRAQPAVAVGSASFGVAVVPDQAPVARFSERVGAAGRPSVFNASASSSPNGKIASYHWNFGNGVTKVTTSPIVRYRYPLIGTYRVTLSVVSTDGTSTQRTFTGQMVSNNGSSTSGLAHVALIPSPLEIYPGHGAPGTSVTLRDATLTTTCSQLNVFFDGLLVSQTSPAHKVLNAPSVVIPGDASVGQHVFSVSCSTPAKAIVNVAFGVVALRTHLSEFSVAMPSPGTLKKHLASAGLFGLLFLLFGRIFAAGFPSEWMDRTYASNFERTTRKIRQRFPWLFIDHTRERPLARRLSVGTVLLLVFVLAASLIDSFLSPGFGLNRTSALLYAGQCIGIGVLTLVSQGPIALAGLNEKKKVHLHVLVGGLVIAVICVVVSRSLGLAPGYCYGLIAVYVLRPTPSIRDEGRYHFVASVVVLIISTAAFFLTVPVFRAATSAHPSTAMVILDPALNMIFLGGFSAVAFGMMPLPFLPGHGVARWNRYAWAGLSVVGLMGYVAVLLSPGSGTAEELHSVGMVPLLSAFTLFATASVGFWAYHLWRAKKSGELELDDEDQEDLEVFAG